MGVSRTSSLFRKTASAMTGPGVTTWRLVRIIPRSASTTKPVACEEAFHSVSNARVLSMRIDTTPDEIRSRVSVHAVSSAAMATVLKSSSRAAVRFLTYVIVFLIISRPNTRL